MIAVVGEALVDLVIGADATAGGTGLAVATALGGAPFNVARTCGRLGADVVFLGAISDDRFGTELVTRLGSDGVDVGWVQRVEVPTTLAVAELSAHGAARYRFYVDGTSAPALTAADPPPGVTTVVTGGLGLVLQPMAVTVTGLLARVPADVLVVVDVNCRPAIIADRDAYVARLESVFARADVVKVSDEDLAYLWPDDEPADAASHLLQRGARVVLLTAGSAGVTVVTARGATHVPAPAVEVVDTIGAGDAFVGAFVAWWTAHGSGRDGLAAAQGGGDADLARAAGAANAVAAVVCTRRGADPPWRHEVGSTDW